MVGLHLFSFGDHTKELFTLLHPSLECVTELETDPKRRFVFFTVTTSDDGVLCVYALSLCSFYLNDYKIRWKIKVREMKKTKKKNTWKV